MSSRFQKIVVDSFKGLKDGLFYGVLFGGIVESLPDKAINKSALLQAATKPEKEAPRSFLHTIGTTTVLSGLAGLITGTFKGMFGKLPEEEKGLDATPSLSADALSHHAREQEPLRAPDASREKSHAEGMVRQGSHVAEVASRPKEEVISR